MLNFKIHLDGNKENAKVLDSCIAGFDEWFEENENPSVDVELEEIYGHDSLDDIEELAINIANALPNNSFIIEGCIDTSESAGEYMNFQVEYKNKKLISKNSGWYLHMYPDDFENYDSFLEYYPKFSEEEFEKFRHDDYYILDSGNGEFVKEIPLSYQHELALDRQSVCPICGEDLHQGVPVCQDAKGIQYHIWCAEEAGIKGELV